MTGEQANALVNKHAYFIDLTKRELSPDPACSYKKRLEITQPRGLKTVTRLKHCLTEIFMRICSVCVKANRFKNNLEKG